MSAIQVLVVHFGGSDVFSKQQQFFPEIILSPVDFPVPKNLFHNRCRNSFKLK
jgi:hypothetical protein